MGSEAMRFLIVWMAGWINSRQLEVLDFLREENRVLREQLGVRWLRCTDDQRRRLAVKGKTAASGSADCSTSTTGAPHDPTIDFWHTT